MLFLNDIIGSVQWSGYRRTTDLTASEEISLTSSLIDAESH
jgi:hypothetical protein